MDHGDDASQRRISSDLGCAEPERSLLISRPGHDLIARPLRDRQRLSSEHRFINVARALGHDAIHRDCVAGPNCKDVARRDGTLARLSLTGGEAGDSQSRATMSAQSARADLRALDRTDSVPPATPR